ncbi:hypothetical protein PC128_g21920 [Phytophthora cactorum]|nr:hypothetical protein PC128_g21920 [Phytophthora cactorum]
MMGSEGGSSVSDPALIWIYLCLISLDSDSAGLDLVSPELDLAAELAYAPPVSEISLVSPASKHRKGLDSYVMVPTTYPSPLLLPKRSWRTLAG